MGHSPYSFPKKEKLTGKKRIEELFRKGSSFYLDGFRVRYIQAPEENVHKILISVPKKLFKRAVDRNLLKRRIREAYRLHKHLITHENREVFYSIGFLYLSKDILTFHDIEAQLTRCLMRLHKTMEKE